MSGSRQEKIDYIESVINGSVAGAAEVFIDHPLWTAKTRAQSHQPFTFNPTVLYRGILPNAASMIPITGFQVFLNSFFQNILFGSNAELTNMQKIMSAAFAGAGSAFVSCKVEMVMTRQGLDKVNFSTAYKHIYKEGGLKRLYTALPMTMVREGIFTSFFLAVTPILKNEIKPYFKNDYLASLIAGMSAGIGATVVSQGFDTIKTNQQVDPNKNLRETVKKIYSGNGALGFFRGGIARGTRVMSAVTIMSFVNEKMQERLRKK